MTARPVLWTGFGQCLTIPPELELQLTLRCVTRRVMPGTQCSICLLHYADDGSGTSFCSASIDL